MNGGRSAPGGDGGPPSASHGTSSAATPRRSPERGPAGKPPVPKLAEEAFIGPLGEWAREVAERTEATAQAILVQALAVFGCMLGGSAITKVGPQAHAGALFAVVVGATSRARKGTSWSVVAELFGLVDGAFFSGEGRRVVSGVGSGEGIIQRLQGDDRRLLALRTEFGGVLSVAKREGSSLSAVLREAWDGSPLDSGTKDETRLQAESYHLALVGHITREELRARLSDTDAANGLLNRLLLVASERSKRLPFGGETRDLSEKTAGYLRSSLDWARRRTWAPVGFDERGREEWVRAYGAQDRDPGGVVGLATSRSEAQMLRLAVVFALASERAEIGPADVRAAEAIVDLHEATARWIWGNATGDRDQDRILEALAEGPKSLAEILQGVFGGRRTQARDVALASLLERGRIVEHETKTGGRTAKTYRLQGAEEAEEAEEGRGGRGLSPLLPLNPQSETVGEDDDGYLEALANAGPPEGWS